MATNGIKEVKISNTNYLIEPTVYTTTKESAATATYTADLTNFELFNGVVVTVRFATTNNANATLNINETGAKPIYYNGAKLTANKLPALHLYPLVYDTSIDTNGGWRLVGDLDTNTQSNYGNITTAGKIGTTADLAVYTTTGGLVTAGSLATDSPTAATTTSTTFIDTISQDSKGKISATKKTLPTASTSTAGITKVGANGGAAAYDHNHDSTYLKLDGSNNMSGDLGIVFGDTDKFLHFKYSTGSLINNSWRMGVLGSGAGNSNYYVIQSGGVNNSTQGAWVTTLRIGQQNYDVGLAGDVYPINNTQTLGNSTNKWNSLYTKLINQAITGTGTVGSYTNSTYYPAKWTFNTGMTAQEGDIVTIKLPCAGHDYGVFMSIDNGANYYPVVVSGTGRVTTHYPSGGYITVIFNSSGSAASMFALAGQTSSTRITVSGGVWQVLNYYDSGNSGIYQNYNAKPYKVGTTAITAYDLIAEDINGYLVPAHKIAHRVGGPIFIKDGALAANATGSWTGLYDRHYNLTIRKDGNNLSLTTYAPVFLKGTISAGIFTPDTTTPFISTKANCNVSGAYYMYIGDATGGTTVSFNNIHPYYYYDGTNLLLYTEQSGNAATVNGLTVQTAVPANAVFTDTNKYHKSGSWSGLTYTATAVNSADELKFTIPDNYGDTKNPYGTKAKNLVLAGPSSGSNAAPSFRALVAADIPNLSWNKITSDKPTTLSGYGITDAIKTVTSTDNAIVRFDGTSGAIQNSGVKIDDNDHLIAPSIRIANIYYGISFGRTTRTPVETILHTGIKWVSNSHMPVIHITGYAYGLHSPVEFKIGFYIYGDKIDYCGATNMGSWEPDIYLFKEARDGTNYVAVGLAGSCYFLQLSVDLQDEMGKFNNVISTGWNWDFLTTTGTIPSVDDGTTCVKVPYKASIFGAKYAKITTTSNAIAYYIDTTGTFGSKASENGALYATSANGALQWGTLPVAQGGTGATSFTANSVIISGSTTTSALTTRGIKNMTSAGNLGWTSNSTDNTILTTNTLAYWNGRYNSTTSNLAYCNKGAFGTIITNNFPTTSASTKYLRGDGSWVTLSDMGLSTAMHYKGAVEAAPTTTAPTGTFAAGDVVVYSNSEYVYDGENWRELGSESSFKTIQSTVSSPSVPSSGTTTATAFIDTISQDTNGVITATKKDLPTASTSVAGIIKIGTGSSNAMAGNTTVTNVAIAANTTTNGNYPVVFATSNKDTTAAKNEGLQKSGTKFYFNPNSGTLYTTVLDSSVLKLHQGTAVNPSTSSNARIEFDYSSGQPVHIAYTPNDSYRVPAGLKIMGNGTTSSGSSPAWLEVEGDVYAAGFNGPLTGNADTATTATNLAAKPSLAASGNNITVTAGGKTSDAFTVPYATNTGNADQVDGSHVYNGDFLYKGSASVTITGNTDHYIKISTGQRYYGPMMQFAIHTNYNNVQGATKIEVYGRERKFLIKSTGYNGNNFKGFYQYNSDNDIYYIKVAGVSSGEATITVYCSASSITLTEIIPSSSDYAAVSTYEYTDNPSAGSIFSSNLWLSIIPRLNNTYELGSSNYKWANVYATTFVGNVTGNVSGSSGSCTGNAATASKLGTSNVGSNRRPIYLSGGAPAEANYTVAHFGSAGKSNMNDIGRLYASSGMTALTSTSNVDTPKNGNTYSSSWHLYWDACYTDDPNGANAWVAQIVNKAGTDNWWVRSRAGGTITNGTAWASNWRHLVTSTEAAVGSVTQPVFINENGEAQACDVLQIGGRNLLKNSHSTSQDYTYPSSSYSDKASWTTATVLYGGTYTLSFWAKSTVEGDVIRVHFYNPSNITSVKGSQGQSSAATDGLCNFTLSTVWTKYWVTYTIPIGSSTRSVIIPRLPSGSGTGTVSFMWEKLEAGNQATDWSPAWEDLAIAADYLPLSGGQMTGPLTWKDSTALPEKTSANYFLAIDAFTDGGKTYWVSKANVLSSIGAAPAVTGGYLPLSGGKMTGRIYREGVSTSWGKGRDAALVATSTLNGYSPFASIKTNNGSWDIGAYNNASYTNDLIFSYVTDTQYSGNQGATAHIKFLENGHIIAALDGNADTATSATSATTADKLTGFSSHASTMTWGNQTGSVITCFASSGGGGWGFRDNNPASGQLSMTIDGTIYIKEGTVNIGDAIKSITRSGNTFTYTTLWGGTGTFTQTDANVTHTLGATTKYYVTGTTSATTSTGGDTFDTGVYVTTTAGELSAARHSWNASGTEKAYTIYNTTDDSIDFVFI